MRLRSLDVKDAALMLEWMHDEDVVKDLHNNFLNATIDDCKLFIKNCHDNSSQIHLAITDQNDTYMGTVSLKHINKQRKEAEFAIVIRRIAMGKGYAQYAMKEILEMAHDDYGLDYVYWCVSKNNYRAIRFYQKCMYTEVEDLSIIPLEISSRYQGVNNLRWFVSDIEMNRKSRKRYEDSFC